MKLIQPRTDLGVAMMIIGLPLQAFFGLPFGIAVAGAGFLLAAHSIFRGDKPGKLMLAALVLASLGALWFQATRNSGPSDPPTMESVTSFAEGYRASLAGGDLDGYLEVARPQLGDTLEEVFALESQCLNWLHAQFVVAPHGIAPYMAVVTYTAEDTELVREFMFQSDTDEWTVTAQRDC